MAHVPAISAYRRIELFEIFIPNHTWRDACVDLPIQSRSPAYGRHGTIGKTEVNLGRPAKM